MFFALGSAEDRTPAAVWLAEQDGLALVRVTISIPPDVLHEPVLRANHQWKDSCKDLLGLCGRSPEIRIAREF